MSINLNVVKGGKEFNFDLSEYQDLESILSELEVNVDEFDGLEKKYSSEVLTKKHLENIQGTCLETVFSYVFYLKNNDFALDAIDEFSNIDEAMTYCTEDNFIGKYDSLEDYCHEYIEQTYIGLPTQVLNWIDYDTVSRDISHDLTVIKTGYDVYIFSND